ncbi:hypothetical protein [Nonomuraea antri]|uniref:hypothetical protein n=1 Tax=Nonomuraea antri TaxID=2730852 RepID=UPI001F2B4310|nr:hypothetical protein [Nonomuraea antri]
MGGGVEARRAWLDGMRAAMLPELPPEPTIAQLDAWLELAGLLADEDFRQSLRRLSEDFWAEPRDLSAWQRANARAVAEVRAAVRAGIEPGSAEAAPVLERVLDLMGQTGPELLASFDRHDRRAERLWELVAIVRGGTRPPDSPGSPGSPDSPSSPGSPSAASEFGWIERALRATGSDGGKPPSAGGGG